jgi:hypothetical protein
MIPRKPRDPVELAGRGLKVLEEPADSEPGPRVVVGVTARHDHTAHLERCLGSVAVQSLGAGEVVVVLLIDTGGRAAVPEVPLPHPLEGRTWILAANCGSAARARNAVLDFVDARLPSAKWVARLDADDCFATPTSLAGVVDLGEAAGARFVVAGNRVLSRAGDLLRLNHAHAGLKSRPVLLERLRQMATGTADNELPSCNLLLATGTKWRYPEFSSGEDHWLVTELLFHRPSAGVIAEGLLYADYTVDGDATQDARKRDAHRRSRTALYDAARTWDAVASEPGEILGWGNEGIVRRHEGLVIKTFYPGILSAQKAAWLSHALGRGQTLAPVPVIEQSEDEAYTARYSFLETRPADALSEAQVAAFLLECLEHRLVFANVKRSNFRVASTGQLVYIDVGNWIIPMDVSYFRDAAARLYSIGVLGQPDDELLRRPTDFDAPLVWHSLPGFADFYRGLVTAHATKHWKLIDRPRPTDRRRRPDVTLLIKTCAMDAETLQAQAIHIVDQLVGPGDFAERILLIDSFPGPFVRQHTTGDLPRVFEIAESLLRLGVFDRVLVASLDESAVSAVNRRWFDVDCASSRSIEGVPVAPQLWGFEQVTTRYVLQADVDVLIGRRNPTHDVVADMVAACMPSDVLGVAFNIARPLSDCFRPYFAEPGQFVPEVRLGLLDLQRISALRPLPNRVVDGRLEKTWYRSLESLQRERGLRTVRGGDSDTFYVHPMNDRKGEGGHLARIRDLVSQGRVPSSQLARWDLEAPDHEWQYALRPERIVIYAAGRDIEPDRIERFCRGLAIQDDQDFGVIVVDDAPASPSPRVVADRLAFLGDRLSLVRTATHRGRMANLVWALRELCPDPETLVVILDLDDALMDRRVVGDLSQALRAGHDLIIAAPFRPDDPTRVYSPNFENARETYGGDVWIHLRAFKKRLFDALPDELLQEGGEWLAMCTDYATMVPMSEIAGKPVYLPHFTCWHERSTRYSEETSRQRDGLVLRLLSKPAAGSRRSRGGRP